MAVNPAVLKGKQDRGAIPRGSTIILWGRNRIDWYKEGSRQPIVGKAMSKSAKHILNGNIVEYAKRLHAKELVRKNRKQSLKAIAA